MSKKDNDTLVVGSIVALNSDKKKVTSEIFNVPPPEFVPVEMEVYSPTRMDYFATRALQGLLVGRAEKDRRACAKDAVKLAKELIELVDSA